MSKIQDPSLDLHLGEGSPGELNGGERLLLLGGDRQVERHPLPEGGLPGRRGEPQPQDPDELHPLGQGGLGVLVVGRGTSLSRSLG